MITFERLGIRNSDDNPVIETSTYIPAEIDHPLAVELEGFEGFWVRIAVGNSFTAIGAREVTEAQFNAAKSELEDLIEIREIEAQEQRDRIRAELDSKRTAIRAELSKLGLSSDTITAIIDQVRQG